MLPTKLKREYEDYLTKNMPRFEKADSIREFLHILYVPLHFTDCGLIEHIIKRLGSKDLKCKMAEYKKYLLVFLRGTTVKHIIQSEQWLGERKSDLPEGFIELKAVINHKSSLYNLSQLDGLRRKFCSQLRLTEVIVYLKGAKDFRSFLVSWLIPAVLCQEVMEAVNHLDTCFVLREQIVMIIVGEKTFYPQDNNFDKMVSCMIHKITGIKGKK